MKYFGHKKLLCEVSKLSKSNAIYQLLCFFGTPCIYFYLQEYDIGKRERGVKKEDNIPRNGRAVGKSETQDHYIEKVIQRRTQANPPPPQAGAESPWKQN